MLLMEGRAAEIFAAAAAAIHRFVSIFIPFPIQRQAIPWWEDCLPTKTIMSFAFLSI